MKITIQKNDAPTMPKCEMLCDGGLNPKLDNYELTKFLNKHSTNLLIGSAGSGKTSLLYSMFKSNKLLKKVFHNVFLFQPNASASSIKDNIFTQIPDEQRYDELTSDNLGEVMDFVRNEDKDYNNAIIIDDMGAYLKDYEVEKQLKDLIFNRRHYRTSVFFLVQSYMSVPLSIRKLFSNLFVFKVAKKELKTIFDELLEKQKDCYLEISKIVYDKPYQYLFLNAETQRVFKCFDELIIDEEKE